MTKKSKKKRSFIGSVKVFIFGLVVAFLVASVGFNFYQANTIKELKEPFKAEVAYSKKMRSEMRELAAQVERGN